jgi:hypothetical protein
MFLTTIYLFIIGLRIKEDSFSIKFIWYLSILSLIDSIIYIITVIIFKQVELFLTISKWWQLFYIFFEFIIIANFLFQINNTRNKSFFLKIFTIILSIIAIVTIINNDNFKETYYTLFTLFELIFINIFAVRFLMSNSIERPSLTIQKNTLITKGIFVFINIASPYYLVTQLISKEPNTIISSLSFISNIGYIILFASIIKSYKCQMRN